jgi:small subunit ribosomal protein S8
MSMTDPIADMLTRVRNGIMANFAKIDIPASGLKIGLAKILKEEGFIKNFKIIKDRKQGILRVFLKYNDDKSSVISGLERISKPSRRIYVKAEEIPSILNGLGIAIISTSQGVITDREARKLKVGGEIICSVW